MAVFFADSRLWLGGNLRCWLRKLATFEDSKMACSNRRCFGCEKGLFFQLMQDNLEKKGFWVTKKQRFQFVQSQPIKKSFFSTRQNLNFHRTPTNVQPPFSNTACHCELAVWLLFFETSQSCVSTKVTLSHRFKSSPSIPGNLVVFTAAGYMMNAGHFRRNLESSGDLNRPRSPEVRKPLGYFWFFSYKRKE